MGKNTGFLELERVSERYQEPGDRRRHYREFVLTLSDGEAGQQGARCLDCGIPFCHSACPVHNIIPDWNDLVYRGNLDAALRVLHATNNFPEVTGRICPAPCEEACTLNINQKPIGIKSIERYIVDRGWAEGKVLPQPPAALSGRKVVVVGSGPAGLACAQQLVRLGHAVTVLEKNSRPGGLLRYGIPDFKLEKFLVERRLAQLSAEGVVFRCNVVVVPERGVKFNTAVAFAGEELTFDELAQDYDAVVLACGAEAGRDLAVEGRDLAGVHFAMEYLSQQNKANAGDVLPQQISAEGKHVVVIGGGDTGSDCVGTANRQGAKSVTQFELLPMPPEQENKPLVWPYWPLKLRTSSSHLEGCDRDFAVTTKKFVGRDGQVAQLIAQRLTWEGGKMAEVPDSSFALDADLVLLAMGFVSPLPTLVAGFSLDARGNVKASVEEGGNAYATSREKFFAAGDVRRGQSLVVWAIREGRQCAAAVDRYLGGAGAAS